MDSSPAEYSDEVSDKTFCRNVACDVTESVASHLVEYSAAAEQASENCGVSQQRSAVLHDVEGCRSAFAICKCIRCHLYVSLSVRW